jgi:hypothetical protein
MDQVRTIAVAVWQQRFWVLSVTGILVALYCWNTATTDLAAKFTTRKAKITGQFNDVTSITNEAFHPNDAVINAGNKQVEAQKVLVGELWNELYQQQKNDVLFWPDLEGNRFAERMGKKEFNDEIELDLREQYVNYIKSQFDELRKIVKASSTTTKSRRPSFEFGGSEDPAERGPGVNATDEDYLVDWLDQDILSGQLLFRDSNMPSSQKIWVTQENIWVYKTLLNVIAKTNELYGATRPDNTAIRRILQLQVGRDAVKEYLRKDAVYIPSGEGDFDAQDFGSQQEADGQLEPGSTEDVFGQRYLDEAGEPLEGDSGEFGREYRKLPIRMVLLMDQRIIPKVLVECANATLPIEVTRLSVNRDQSNVTGFSMGSGRSRSNSIKGSGKFLNDRNLSTIEIQGTVLIYQPPEDSYSPAEVAQEDGVAEVPEEPST